MRKTKELFRVDDLIKFGGFVFCNVLAHLNNTATENPFAEVNLNDVADLYVVGRLYCFTVDSNVAFGAGIVGNTASFDDAGYFQEFV